MKLCELTKAQKADLRKLIDAATEALGDLAQYAADIAGKWESAIEEKSDRWLDSDPGQEAQGRLEEFQGWLDELPDADIGEPPGME